jgi:hypothetical protein
MIAAIYARKSTDQNLPDAEKSVTRQVDHATRYRRGHRERRTKRRAAAIDAGLTESPPPPTNPCRQAGGGRWP